MENFWKMSEFLDEPHKRAALAEYAHTGGPEFISHSDEPAEDMTEDEWHEVIDKAQEVVARWRKRLVWRENRPPEHFLTHLKQMEILAEEAHNKLVLIECMADHCAICMSFANVVCDIVQANPDLVFMQVRHLFFAPPLSSKEPPQFVRPRNRPSQINKMDRYNGHKMFECLKVGKFRDPHKKYKTPTYMFFRNGEQIDEVIGANQPELIRIVKKHSAWDPNAPPVPDSDEEDETVAAAQPEIVEDDDQE